MRSQWINEKDGDGEDDNNEEGSVSPTIHINNQEDWPWIKAMGRLEIDNETTTMAEERRRQCNEFFLPFEIIPGVLWLGSIQCIFGIPNNLRRLREELGISSILNMADAAWSKRPCPPWYPQEEWIEERDKFTYKGINAADDPNYPLLKKHWEDAYEFLRLNCDKSNGKKCLIHCVAGINRSVLIACAYYMISTRTPVLEAVQYVRRKRGKSNDNQAGLSNVGFQIQLVALARQHGLLGAQPVAKESCVLDKIPSLEEQIALEEQILK